MDQNAYILEFLRRNYAIVPDSTISPIAGGEENRSLFISAGADRFVLRIYSTHHSTTGLRKAVEIEFELDFIEAALAHGVPTPTVIRTRDGERITVISIDNQPQFMVLFGYAPGKEANEYDFQTARATAGVLHGLRKTSLAFRKPCPRRWPGDIVRLSLEFYAANRPQVLTLPRHVHDLLNRLFYSAYTGYAKIRTALLPTGVIHGDVKLGNLLFADGKVTAVIDFDDYRKTFLIEEFTRTVMHDLDSPTRNAIRAGYYPLFWEALSTDSTVTAAEMAHLITFLRARLLYDLTAYSIAGLEKLVDEVIADQQVQETILADI